MELWSRQTESRRFELGFLEHFFSVCFSKVGKPFCLNLPITIQAIDLRGNDGQYRKLPSCEFFHITEVVKIKTLSEHLLLLTDAVCFDKTKMFVPLRKHSFLLYDRDFPTIKRHIKKFDQIFTVGEIKKKVIENRHCGMGINKFL